MKPKNLDDMSVKERAALMMSCGEETITPNELEGMIGVKDMSGEEIRVYDGFEVNLQIHIAQGVKSFYRKSLIVI